LSHSSQPGIILSVYALALLVMGNKYHIDLMYICILAFSDF